MTIKLREEKGSRTGYRNDHGKLQRVDSRGIAESFLWWWCCHHDPRMRLGKAQKHGVAGHAIGRVTWIDISNRLLVP